jgi:hypothetical protein
MHSSVFGELHCRQLAMLSHATQVEPTKAYPNPCPQSVQEESELQEILKTHVPFESEAPL